MDFFLAHGSLEGGANDFQGSGDEQVPERVLVH
jgi:hypothetical protein